MVSRYKHSQTHQRLVTAIRRPAIQQKYKGKPPRRSSESTVFVQVCTRFPRGAFTDESVDGIKTIKHYY